MLTLCWVIAVTETGGCSICCANVAFGAIVAVGADAAAGDDSPANSCVAVGTNDSVITCAPV